LLTAAMVSPRVYAVGRSFMECTATSISRASRASSISLVKKPFPSILSKETF